MKLIIALLTILALSVVAHGAVDSYAKLNSSSLANRATCSVSLRGLVWNIESGASTADYRHVCSKSSADTYTWASI